MTGVSSKTRAEVSAPMQRVESVEDDIDLMALVATLWRGAGWIAGAATLMAFIGFIVIKFFTTPLYTAHSKVAFDDRQQTMINH